MIWECDRCCPVFYETSKNIRCVLSCQVVYSLRVKIILMCILLPVWTFEQYFLQSLKKFYAIFWNSRSNLASSTLSQTSINPRPKRSDGISQDDSRVCWIVKVWRSSRREFSSKKEKKKYTSKYTPIFYIRIKLTYFISLAKIILMRQYCYPFNICVKHSLQSLKKLYTTFKLSVQRVSVTSIDLRPN